MTRRVCYVTGTRADFGLMASTLQRIQEAPTLDLSVCVTGMHLSAMFGQTVREVEAAALRIAGRVPVAIETGTGAGMAIALGQALIGFVEVLQAERPDLVLVLGDRGEMLAGALAAIHLNVPVAHIHGGERSGTVDEPVRHAITKLAHYHFAATTASQERIVRMGEDAAHVFVTGAPGLCGLLEVPRTPPATLFAGLDLDPTRPTALVLFHPVLQEATQAADQVITLIRSVKEAGLQALVLMPNADAGGHAIRAAMELECAHPDARLVTHLPRQDFISWLAAADVMVGNSSSGIIEAASFGLPVVNVGERQRGRERSGNVCDVAVDQAAITAAIRQALKGPRWQGENVYGDGRAAERIVDLLTTLPLGPSLLAKMNSY